MPSVTERVEEIQIAIGQLRSAAIVEDDASRRESADRLDLQFAEITSPTELLFAARDALRLFAGGMGSFSDAGTSEMQAAITRLFAALRQAI